MTVVEIKPADYNLDALSNDTQIVRYLQQYGLVLITNLREFRLLQLTPTGTVLTLERYTLAVTPAALWSAPITSFARHGDLLPDFLARVMLYRAPLAQPKDVAWLLASYAREARARAEDHPLGSFRTVKVALQESLGIQFEGEKGEHFFRSTLVQTLFYGIFSAWILWRRAPESRTPTPDSTGASPLTIYASPSSASSLVRYPTLGAEFHPASGDSQPRRRGPQPRSACLF